RRQSQLPVRPAPHLGVGLPPDSQGGRGGSTRNTRRRPARWDARLARVSSWRRGPSVRCLIIEGARSRSGRRGPTPVAAGAKLGPGPRPTRRGGGISLKMDCPKCGHQQTDTVKCASCGIYFAKFAQHQASLTGRSGGARDEGAEAGFGWGALALTAILSTALAWYFLRGHTTAPATLAAPATAATNAAPIGPAPPAPLSAGPSPHALRGLEAQLAKTFPARNAIDTARNATVFIKTGWGMGSGFII